MAGQLHCGLINRQATRGGGRGGVGGGVGGITCPIVPLGWMTAAAQHLTSSVACHIKARDPDRIRERARDFR